ncbi:SH3 domain-binding protein 1 [Engraulis encrasicolus]|uniref:SH3 domain-binding protein 1 n=1 Tax=Engraulis encrasicolus TaxID=184585 RepID=UPI002FD220F9
MLKFLNQFGSISKSQDATDLLEEDLVLVEQRVEPTRKAAHIIHKKLAACLQSQPGLDADKRMKKLPLMLLYFSMAECLKDLDAESSIRRVLEMCCSVQCFLAQTLSDFELKLEKEVLEPLHKLSEEDLPEILKNKKQFTKLTTDWHAAKTRSQASTGPQAKQDGLREEVEEAWRKLDSMKDNYSADLYLFATREDEYANYFTRLLELQAEYHEASLDFLKNKITAVKENPSQPDTPLGSSSQKVYGEALHRHLENSERRIATPIQECVEMLLKKGLKEEGLFRLAAAASVVKRLKSSLDAGMVDHSEFSVDPHAVAGALKSYLRELPEPLMTSELYQDWFKAAEEKEVPDKLESFKEVLKKLPKENYNNLRYLVQFLACLSEYQVVNKMTPSNIAIVLGPNLLWPQKEGEHSILDMASASSVQVVMVIEPLIQYSKSLFPEEPEFEVPDPPSSPGPTASGSPGPERALPSSNPSSPRPTVSKTFSCGDTHLPSSPQPLVKSNSVSRGTISWETKSSEPAPAPAPDDASVAPSGVNQTHSQAPVPAKRSIISMSTQAVAAGALGETSSSDTVSDLPQNSPEPSLKIPGPFKPTRRSFLQHSQHNSSNQPPGALVHKTPSSPSIPRIPLTTPTHPPPTVSSTGIISSVPTYTPVLSSSSAHPPPPVNPATAATPEPATTSSKPQAPSISSQPTGPTSSKPQAPSVSSQPAAGPKRPPSKKPMVRAPKCPPPQPPPPIPKQLPSVAQ